MSAIIKRLVPSLLAWFSTNARDLPWRRTRDPYAIWVSEIMLQQTQVKTVIPYWERWLRALPTIASLAEADSATIHKLWEGLGYYTRVRNMQKAAQQIVARHAGIFPRDHADILDLPGIGPYTAGAIASIAFNEPQPILDGNVIRVLTRLFAIQENPREKTTNQKLWSIAKDLVTTAASSPLNPEHLTLNTGSCSALNQSLMELGAIVCTPTQPKCPLCPIRSHCLAYKLKCPEKFPNLGPRPTATQLHHLAFVLEHQGRYLVRQRPAGQVNAHLWEFPNLASQTTTLPTASQIIERVRQELNLAVKNPSHLRTIKHSITRYRITLHAFQMKTISIRSTDKKSHWLTLDQLHALPFTSAHKKILQTLENPKNQKIEAEWDAEITRRVEEIKFGSTKGIPAAEVMKKARRALNEKRDLI